MDILSNMVSVVSQRAKFPRYNTYSKRLSSFAGWCIAVSPTALANAGMWYAGSGNKTYCYFCKYVFYNWCAGMVPMKEHVKLNPACGYLQLLPWLRKLAIVDACRVLPYVPPHFKNEVVQTVLGMDLYDSNYINYVLERHGSEPYTSVAALLCDLAKYERRTSRKELLDLREERKRLIDLRLCKVCNYNTICILVLPCRHLAICKLCRNKLRQCPICRNTIYATIDVFLA